MADDHIQRAQRASQPPVRNAPGNGPGSAGVSDPLAELARLIGQNDPFGEYGRNNGRGAPFDNQAPAYAPQPGYVAPPQHDLHAAPAGYGEDRYAPPDVGYPVPRTQPAPAFAPPPAPPPPHYGQQDYDAAYAQEAYAQDPYAQGIVPGQGGTADYEQGAYFQNSGHSPAEDEHYYDDVPPRRRVGVLAIAAVFALAVIGTAGAFGYRTLFGSSGAKSAPPPVIKADATPTKIVPAAPSKDPQNGKMIYDRVNGQNEKVVSREEQPVDINKPVGSLPTQPSQSNGATQQASLGTGVIGGVEPKKIHTIAIHPTQQAAGASAEPVSEPSPPPPAPQRVQQQNQQQLQQVAAPSRAVAEAPPARQAQPAAEPKPTRSAPQAPANAPLSLSPSATANANAAAPPAAQARPTRTASAPAATAPAQSVSAGSAGGYAVQIVSRHNEADAQASFQSLQSKFPQQLGGRTPLIRRVDLGAKGVYYRAMVGPFGSADEASQLCSNLKAAGGDCLIQKI